MSKKEKSSFTHVISKEREDAIWDATMDFFKKNRLEPWTIGDCLEHILRADIAQNEYEIIFLGAITHGIFMELANA